MTHGCGHSAGSLRLPARRADDGIARSRVIRVLLMGRAERRPACWPREAPSLATILNVLLLAVGVATMTVVIVLSNALETRLAREAAGIDLVVGAKGSPLQLVLAGIYHADVPPGNVPLAAVEDLARNPLVRQVIPLALGDSFHGYRIVGTEPSLIAHYGATLARGRIWMAPMEAVLGHDVPAHRVSRLGVIQWIARTWCGRRIMVCRMTSSVSSPTGA
jgi:hypothetical protein